MEKMIGSQRVSGIHIGPQCKYFSALWKVFKFNCFLYVISKVTGCNISLVPHKNVSDFVKIP